MTDFEKTAEEGTSILKKVRNSAAAVTIGSLVITGLELVGSSIVDYHEQYDHFAVGALKVAAVSGVVAGGGAVAEAVHQWRSRSPSEQADQPQD